MQRTCGLTLEEHRDTCAALTDLSARLRKLTELLKGRYVRGHAAVKQSSAAIISLRSLAISLQGQAAIEHRQPAVNYLAATSANPTPSAASLLDGLATAGDGIDVE